MFYCQIRRFLEKMKNKKIVWRVFLATSFSILVIILGVILFFLNKDRFRSAYDDINVSEQFTCPDGSTSIPNPSVISTCPFSSDPEACIIDAPQGCININHPQGIGGSDPFCTPGQSEVREGTEYLCVGYPYGSDGCVYFSGCRGFRNLGSGAGTDAVQQDLCGSDGRSNCTLVNDGTCGSITVNNQRILCVSNVDTTTVCYERNDDCTVGTEDPITTDPVDQETTSEGGSLETDSTVDSSSDNTDDNTIDNLATDPTQSTNPQVLPNTSKSTTFSLTLLLGLSFLMVGLILNRFGSAEFLLNSIKSVEKNYSIIFPKDFKDFLEKRNKNMVDYERKRFESNLENEQ